MPRCRICAASSRALVPTATPWFTNGATSTSLTLPMTWPNQNPPAIDVILHLNVPCAGYGAASPCYLEIDKLDDGRYRATVGTLFEHEEVCLTHDLEAL